MRRWLGVGGGCITAASFFLSTAALFAQGKPDAPRQPNKGPVVSSVRVEAWVGYRGGTPGYTGGEGVDGVLVTFRSLAIDESVAATTEAGRTPPVAADRYDTIEITPHLEGWQFDPPSRRIELRNRVALAQFYAFPAASEEGIDEGVEEREEDGVAEGEESRPAAEQTSTGLDPVALPGLPGGPGHYHAPPGTPPGSPPAAGAAVPDRTRELALDTRPPSLTAATQSLGATLDPAAVTSKLVIRVVELRDGRRLALDGVRLDFRNLTSDRTGWRRTREGAAFYYTTRGGEFEIRASRSGFRLTPQIHRLRADAAEVEIVFEATREGGGD
jgi:hypothetical protein